jgi:hypothetical protein
MAQRGYKTIRTDLAKAGETAVYTSPRVADALEKIIQEATVYEGVKVLQICEAFYLQGKKDGARAVFEEQERALTRLKREIPHQKPGRPRKR